MGCQEVSPEQQAADAAQGYYQRLLDGYPDGFLAGKAAYDEMPSDSAKADSIDKAEKEEAKKVYNSIRKEEAKEEASDGSTTEGESTSSGNTGEGSSEQKTVEPISVAPANKPKVESIEN